MLDLATLDIAAAADKGAVMTLVHPVTGDDLVQDNGKPVTITLAGNDSSRFRSANRALVNRRMEARAKNRKMVLSAEEIEADSVALLAAATIDWSGIVLDGAALSFSAENAGKLYKRISWVREQADTFISERANFLPSAPSA